MSSSPITASEIAVKVCVPVYLIYSYASTLSTAKPASALIEDKQEAFPAIERLFSLHSFFGRLWKAGECGVEICYTRKGGKRELLERSNALGRLQGQQSSGPRAGDNASGESQPSSCHKRRSVHFQ